MRKLLITFIPCLILSLSGLRTKAQSSSLVTNYNKQEYAAGSQNWSMDIDSQGFLYVGNNDGLLVFDGTHWRLYSTPGQAIVRSVSVSPDGRIYVGSYEEFGYWKKETEGKMAYHSLKPLLKNYKFHNNEIWKIVRSGNKVYFQSFSSLFVYDGQTVKSIELPGNIIFLLKAAERMFVQAVNGPLFELKNDRFAEIQGSSLLAGSEIKTILPLPGGDYLIGTTSSGMFIYNGRSFIPWKVPANELLRKYQVNNGILSGDKLVIGTIVKGVFILDFRGNVLNHFDTDNSLQNNTVLSLCSDRNRSIWVGLDKGIDNISFDNPIDIYQERGEQLGAVYTATLQGNTLYVGTNRGVFTYSQESGKFYYTGMLDNSQGQVWQLININGSIFCGHTNGTYLVKGNSLQQISNVSGGFTLCKLIKNEKEYLLQATYSTLVLYRKSGNDWVFSNQLEGYIEPSRFLETDHLGNIWVGHSVKGLYRLRLSDDLKKVIEINILGQKDGLPSDFNVRVFKIANRVVFTTGSRLYTWDDLNGKLMPFTELNRQLEGFESSTSIVDAGNDNYWFIRKNDIALFHYSNNHAVLLYRLLLPLYKLNMVDNYENIIPLGSGRDLICLDNGFAIFNNQFLSSGFRDHSRLIWSEAYSYDAEGNIREIRTPDSKTILSHSFNNLYLAFSVINKPGITKLFQYQMEGLDAGWSNWSSKAEARYTRLPKGEYDFRVRTLDISGKLTDSLKLHIIVNPAWYASGLAVFLYLLISIGLLWSSFNLFRRRIIRQHQKLRNQELSKAQTEKQLSEQEIITLQNQNLQSEISHKTIQLADSTMSVIRKNELLIEIKDELIRQKEVLGARYPGRYFDRINNLIEKNISNDNDWKVFEALFDQAHENFFRRLKASYPDLTQSDLKLCAYLRLNLSSKEIAPLLNISIRGVEIRRYRLRKRLALPTDSNLVNYILQF